MAFILATQGDICCTEKTFFNCGIIKYKTFLDQLLYKCRSFLPPLVLTHRVSEPVCWKTRRGEKTCSWLGNTTADWPCCLATCWHMLAPFRCLNDRFYLHHSETDASILYSLFVSGGNLLIFKWEETLYFVCLCLWTINQGWNDEALLKNVILFSIFIALWNWQHILLYGSYLY